MTTPALSFAGTDAAELFTRECRKSLDGLCTWNLIRAPGELPAGFVHASPPGQGWSFSMWTRDWPVLLPEGLARANITMSHGSEGMRFSLAFADGRRVPQAHLRLGSRGRFVRQTFSDVNRLDAHWPQTEPRA
jgi:hypothetical protein